MSSPRVARRSLPGGAAAGTAALASAPSVAGPDAPYSPPRIERRRNVAIVLYPGVELLDFAGPGEVFASNAAFHAYTVAVTRAPLVSQHFVQITPTYSIDEAPKPDIVVIPGGSVAAERPPRRANEGLAEAHGRGG